MKTPELSENNFYCNFTDNVTRWLSVNKPHLRPVHWLCQRGYDAYLFGDALFSIGMGETVGMPSQLTVAILRPEGTPSPVGPLCKAHGEVKALPYGKTYYLSRGYRVDMSPLSTMYWPKSDSLFTEERIPRRLWKCATLNIQACCHTIISDANGGHGLWADPAESPYTAAITRTLELLPGFEQGARNPKYVGWVQGFASQWLKDHPKWVAGTDLQRLLYGSSLTVTGLEETCDPVKVGAPINMM